MKFVVFDGQGEIVIFGEAPDGSAPDANGMGTVLIADGTTWTHYVANGVLLAYTADQASAKAALPIYPAVWSNAAMAWEDQRDIDQARADQWDAVKEARTAAIAAGFVWDGSKFDSDDESQQRIQGAVQLAVLSQAAGQSFSIDWTLFDNSVRTLSGAEMIAVGIALGSFVAAAFAAGVTLRDQIAAAATLEAVRAITWPDAT